MIAPVTPRSRVGKFEFAIKRSEKQPDQQLRAQALAAWLLDCWEAERREDVHEHHRDAS
jgi:hypothetical protein